MVVYDQVRGCYVAYVRMSQGFRRAIGRSESPEFANACPDQQVVLESDPQDPSTDDLYTNGYSRCPGGRLFHLMFPSVYYRTRDVLGVQLAVSRDGVLWHRPKWVLIIPPWGYPAGRMTQAFYASPG